MKRIALIIPYYGSYPKYFPLWLQSAGSNKNIDFWIISDHEPDFELPQNVIFKKKAFKALRSDIQGLYDFRIELDHPYKLCDYKAAYGEIFQPILAPYTHWGYCDVDLIWGNVSRFITDELLEDYDKILKLGHLTIYKNSELVRRVYRDTSGNCYLNYKTAFQSPFNAIFDESRELEEIHKRNGLKLYYDAIFDDINPHYYNFRLCTTHGQADCRGDEGGVFYKWQAGKLFRCTPEGGAYSETETLYAHFQKRDLFLEVPGNFEHGFLIVPNRFLPIHSLSHREIRAYCRNKVYPRRLRLWLGEKKRYLSPRYIGFRMAVRGMRRGKMEET